ncbi:ABC transporter permease [Emcibacter sp. SYSU 3D8]|uniref:ABC transporter permease n=1 Tax=Emcibacter sp. SYSU 3D8 TaxID=3133969 RepID=UPI0031FEB596
MAVLDRKLLRNLRSMATQVIAIALVMAAGIATYVMSTGLIDSLGETRRLYYQDYRFGDVFVSVKRAPEIVGRRLADIPGVQRVETRVAVGAILDVAGMSEPATALLTSLPEAGQPTLNRLHLRAGRLVEPYRENEVVISDAFSEAHRLGPGDSVSALISGHQRQLDIVGVAISPEFVYALPAGALFPDNKRFAVMWMGRAALEAAHDMEGAFNDAVLSLMPNASVADVIDAIDAMTRQYGGRGAYGRKDHQSDMFLRSELDQLRAMAVILPLIFLVVASFLLNTVLARMINLDRAEIGTLKALGLTNREVGWHYAKFAAAIAIAAAVAGIAAGAYFGRSMADMYAEFYRFPHLHYRLDPLVLVSSVALSLVVAFLGVARSVRRVMLLQPAEAMRPEPPVVYRALLFERLGRAQLLSPTARMVLRYLERRWRLTLITCLGIATALGTLIAASFFLDTIDFMLDVQFNRSEREDIAITLVEPASRGALGDLVHMPGVMRAEPYRAVPVKLSLENRTRRLAIVGMEMGGDLHRTLDKRQRPVSLPPDGLLLSDLLAQLLGAKPGDMLTVEVLEGRRPVHQIRVAGIAEQFIGTGAYMDIAALNRLMLEGPSISGAWMNVDEASMSRFYDAAKRTPAIAGVSIRSAAISGFDETMGENLVQMTMVNIVFASIIAFGVVYNSARISVSERGRELASMRVMGFTRGEISTILLGELALLVALAVPLGWLMGYGLSNLMVQAFQTELFRLPVVIDRSTYGWTALVIIAAASVSALVVRRRLDRLDLVAVLKTRE